MRGTPTTGLPATCDLSLACPGRGKAGGATCEIALWPMVTASVLAGHAIGSRRAGGAHNPWVSVRAFVGALCAAPGRSFAYRRGTFEY
jgi:hypothetical protein